MARVITSPTTVPMLPPTNFSSMAQMWTRRPFSLPAAGDDGVAQVRGFLRGGQAVLYFLESTNSSGSVDTRPLIELLELALVEQHRQARPRVQALMVAALGAHLEIVLQRLAPDDLAAALAFQPEPFGADALRAFRALTEGLSRVNQAMQTSV
jgi:hypothetical protein